MTDVQRRRPAPARQRPAPARQRPAPARQRPAPARLLLRVREQKRVKLPARASAAGPQRTRWTCVAAAALPRTAAGWVIDGVGDRGGHPRKPDLPDALAVDRRRIGLPDEADGELAQRP
jgi:hypothetical protein